jgi:cobalt-zinc-cadmium efflux system outer membrane protein
MPISARGVFVALALAVFANSVEALPCSAYSGADTDNKSMITAGAVLTLDAVFAEIRRLSPAVRSAALEARALDAEADQAGRRLNPGFSIWLENFSGNGAMSGFDQAEATFALEQTFRLGAKRSLSERAARARQAVASAECAVVLRQTELEAAILFAELIAAGQLRDLAVNSANLADQLVSTVQRRVDAGAAAPPELARARADAAALRAGVATAEADVNRLRYALALLWGSAEPTFAAPSQFATDFNAPVADSSLAHPSLDRADAAERVRTAEQQLARSAAVPDVTVSAGFRRFEETGDEAFMASISVPLPLFDRGQDTARAVAFRGAAASLNRTATAQQLLARQRAARSARRAAKTRLELLTAEALPAAEEAYKAAVRGYQIGRFDLTTALNARAGLLDMRLAVIDAELVLQSQDLRLRALAGVAPFNGDTQ